MFAGFTDGRPETLFTTIYKKGTMLNHSDIYLDIGRRIKAARSDRKMSQNMLATQVNLTRVSITNIERGRQKLPLHTLMEIAIALQVSLLSLLPENPTTANTQLDQMLNEQPKDAQAWVRKTLKNREKRG